MEEQPFGFVCRYMEEKDLPQVAGIERTVFSLPWSEDGFRAALALPSSLYLAAVTAPPSARDSGCPGQAGDLREQGNVPGAGPGPGEEQTVLGYAGMYISFDEGEIVNVAVHPEHRRRGVAEELLRCLAREGAGRGVTRLILEVRSGNAAAIGLYGKLGFRELGIRRDFYEAPREDALIMELRIG